MFSFIIDFKINSKRYSKIGITRLIKHAFITKYEEIKLKLINDRHVHVNVKLNIFYGRSCDILCLALKNGSKIELQ